MANFHLTGLPSDQVIPGIGLPNLPENDGYKAIITPDHQRTVKGAFVKVDGRRSTSPNTDPLVYYWFFKEWPIGSRVDQHLFLSNEVDDSIVYFSPDVPGYYTIGLIIADNNFLSPMGVAEVSINILMVPHNQGLVPDGDWIWNYLGDFWRIYDKRDRWSTIWSSMIQVAAAEMLDAYQINYNKSIKDIQDLFQKKWVEYVPRLDIDSSECSFIIAEDQAGLNAATSLIGVSPQPVYSNIVTIPNTEGSFTKASYGKPIIPGKVLSVNDSAYTMIRSTEIGNRSALFADNSNIRTGFSTLAWRFSSTLIHKTLNFEEQGVMPGDLLVLEISKSNSNLKTKINVQIVSVNKNRLGFVFNTERLTPGTPSNLLTDTDRISLTTALGIEGLTKAFDGSLVYAEQALVAKTTMESLAFKRSYYETELDSSSVINIGPISITAKPLYIIRNTKVLVDKRIVSIPGLQEEVKQPYLVNESGTLGKVVDGKVYPITREPYVLFENLDYIVDDETPLQLPGFFLAMSDTIHFPWGDLADRGIRENDKLIVSAGLNAGTYTIIEILDNERLRVTPTPQANEANRKCLIIRSLAGKFIRLIRNMFNPKNPAPEKLWAEVTYIGNDKAVEDNFGSLVNFSKENSIVQGITAPYKAAVAGLMYAYSRGPTIYNLKLGAQVLLGLPFSYHRGVIIDINPEYRLDDQGAPLYGRILIEERDKYNRPTGLTDIYLYPRGKQKLVMGKWEDQDPDFAGLGINPKTGKVFKEGDLVDAFSILSKGVEVSDYLSDPTWYSSILGDPTNSIQKYHKAYLRANIDLYGTADFDFVASYLRNTKPHYVFLVALALKSLVDDVIIEDDIFFKAIYTFFEATGLSLPTAVKYDGYFITPYAMVYDGVMYLRYIYGDDLSTTFNSLVVSSPSGGFINPRMNLQESHDTPYVRPGDLLVITSGLNVGKYPVTAINSDDSITISNPGKFQTLSAQDFTVYRPITNPIFTGTINITQLVQECTLTVNDSGKLSSGIAVNDIVVYRAGNSASRKYRITRHESGITGLDALPTDPDGSYPCIIYREDLLVKSLLFDETSNPFSANITTGDPWIAFDPVSVPQLATIQLKDTIYVAGHPPYLVLDFDEVNRMAYVTPTPAANETGIAAKVWRTYLPSKSMSTDVVDLFIRDPLYLEVRDLSSNGYQTTAGSPEVIIPMGVDPPTDLNIVPGDLLRITKIGHPDTNVDIGYGAGYFPIAKVEPLKITLTRPLTAIDPQCSIGYARLIR